MMLSSRWHFTGLVFIATMLMAASSAAQEYPTRTIRIITNAAGGGSDVLARVIAQGMTGSMGQPVVVDNRGSVVPTMSTIASAAPDGYSLVITGGAAWTLPLFEKTPWNMAELSPISVVSREVLVVAVHPSLPVKSVKDLIAFAKARPGQLNYGASGAAGKSTLGIELFKSMSGTNIVWIPYKGTSAVISGAVSGEVQMVISEASLVMPQAKAGKLRALAVTSANPSAVAPGLPTLAETLPGYEWIGMTGAFVPAKTQAAIITRLNREIARVLLQPEVKERFLLSGVEIVASSPEQAAEAIRSEQARTVQIVKDAGIKVNG